VVHDAESLATGDMRSFDDDRASALGASFAHSTAWSCDALGGGSSGSGCHDEAAAFAGSPGSACHAADDSAASSAWFAPALGGTSCADAIATGDSRLGASRLGSSVRAAASSDCHHDSSSADMAGWADASASSGASAIGAFDVRAGASDVCSAGHDADALLVGSTSILSGGANPIGRSAGHDAEASLGRMLVSGVGARVCSDSSGSDGAPSNLESSTSGGSGSRWSGA
jgi:hypothetical protein